jgi:hypothetical protein
MKIEKRHVPAHVYGLNVPVSKAHMINEPGKNSHRKPARGIRTIPKPVEIPFITTSTSAAFFQDIGNA